MEVVLLRHQLSVALFENVPLLLIRLLMPEYTCGTQALENIRDFQQFSIMTVLIIALMDLRFLLLKTMT